MASLFGNSLGVDWVVGLQEGLITDRGSFMVHEMGLACPHCRTSDVHANMLRDGQSQTRSPNCSKCGGDGFLFRSPDLIRGLAVSIRQQRNVHDVGESQPGDMQFSIAPDFGGCGSNGFRRISRDDKFTATWDQPLHEGQTIVRGAATMNENLRLSNNVSLNEDRLWYEPSDSLWCEDQNGVVYHKDADFVLGPGKVIRWVGNQPVKGTKYVIKYTAFFEWIVWAPPMDRVDRDNRDLGPLVFLRKRHIAYVNDSPTITDLDRVPLSTRITC